MHTSEINKRLLFSVFAVNLMAFATGNAYAWSSTVIYDLKSNDAQKNPLGRPITNSEESWIASLVSLGALSGPLVAGYCSDKIGRKKTLLIFAVPMMISHVILAFATTIAEFFVARFMMGVGAGCTFTVVPIYVGEIAETNIRGILGCFLSVMQGIGLLFIYVAGPFVSIMTLSLILIVPIGLFLILFALFVPESPYYYLAKGQNQAAETSLTKLRIGNSSSIQKELNSIIEFIEESKNNTSLKELLKCKSFTKGITITTMLMFFQQSVGITIILGYMESIFIATGTSMSSATCTIIVSFAQLISVILASFLVERWGRKMLYLLASAICAIPLAVVGIFFYVKSIGHDVSHWWYVPVFSLMVYMVGYSFALGPISWTLVGELFSNRTRALASSVTAFTCLTMGFTTSLIFPSLQQLIGYYGAFWLFSVSAVLCFVFVLLYVPETKGKSFQDIQKLLEQ